MKKTEFIKTYAILTQVYVWFKAQSNLTELWYTLLKDLPYNVFNLCVEEWIKTNTKEPTIADIRLAVVNKVNNFLPEDIAYHDATMNARTGVYANKYIKQAVQSCGGSYNFANSTNQTALRSQFRDTYKAIIKREIKEQTTNGIPQELLSNVKQIGE